MVGLRCAALLVAPVLALLVLALLVRFRFSRSHSFDLPVLCYRPVVRLTPCPAEERKPARIWVVQPDVAPLAGTPPRSPERVPWWMDGNNAG